MCKDTLGYPQKPNDFSSLPLVTVSFELNMDV